MAARVGLFAALLLALAPAAAAAQAEPRARSQPPSQAQERSCRQVLPSDVRRIFNTQGQEIIYFRDPVRVLCNGGLRLEADSAIMNRTTSAVQLVGNVVYVDSLRHLTARWANYLGARSQLMARGSVVLTNVKDGSVIKGDRLDYFQASDERPEARMNVEGGRPYAVIPPQADSGGALPDTAVATEVWADRMEFEGDEVFRALGNVELRRGDMTGGSGNAVFNQAGEQVTLLADAFVQTDSYRLEGDRIDAFLSGRQITGVASNGHARVLSEDLVVESDQVDIAFADGDLERMQAWNPVPDSVPRALAIAQDFRLRADSIDARADSLGIREVRAVGRAYGERGEVSRAVQLPAAVSRDWIQGDTILGYFGRRTVIDSMRAAAPPRVIDPEDSVAVEYIEGEPLRDRPPRDSVETVLERIVVIGARAPAMSLYRMPAEEEGQPPSINFTKANKIVLFMDNGDVSRVEMEGPLDGVYLAPARREQGGGEEDAGGGGEAAPPVGPPGGGASAGPGGGAP